MRSFLPLCVFFALLSVSALAQRTPATGIDVYVCNYFESVQHTATVRVTNIATQQGYQADLAYAACHPFNGAGVPGNGYYVEVMMTGPTPVAGYSGAGSPWTMGQNSGLETVFVTSTNRGNTATTVMRPSPQNINNNEGINAIVLAAEDLTNVKAIEGVNTGGGNVDTPITLAPYPSIFQTNYSSNTVFTDIRFNGTASYGLGANAATVNIDNFAISGSQFGSHTLSDGESFYVVLYGTVGTNHDGGGYRVVTISRAYNGATPSAPVSSSGGAGPLNPSTGPNAASSLSASPIVMLLAAVLALLATRL